MISTLFIKQMVITLILNSNLKLKYSPDPDLTGWPFGILACPIARRGAARNERGQKQKQLHFSKPVLSTQEKMLNDPSLTQLACKHFFWGPCA